MKEYLYGLVGLVQMFNVEMDSRIRISDELLKFVKDTKGLREFNLNKLTYYEEEELDSYDKELKELFTTYSDKYSSVYNNSQIHLVNTTCSNLRFGRRIQLLKLVCKRLKLLLKQGKPLGIKNSLSTVIFLSGFADDFGFTITPIEIQNVKLKYIGDSQFEYSSVFLESKTNEPIYKGTFIYDPEKDFSKDIALIEKTVRKTLVSGEYPVYYELMFTSNLRVFLRFVDGYVGTESLREVKLNEINMELNYNVK